MGQFVTVVALWGVPYLVHAQRYTTAMASRLIAVTLAAFVVAVPIAGHLFSRRPHVREPVVIGVGVVLFAVWVSAVAWPADDLPTAVLVALLVTSGAAGGVAMLVFDICRDANPAHRGGTATGLANMGGFSFAVIAQLSVGALLDRAGVLDAGSFQAALAPVVGLLALGLIGMWRQRGGG